MGLGLPRFRRRELPRQKLHVDMDKSSMMLARLVITSTRKKNRRICLERTPQALNAVP